MNRHTLKKTVIAIGLLGLVGAVGAETYYHHDTAKQLKAAEKTQEPAPPATAGKDDSGMASDPWAMLHEDMMRIQQDMNREWAQAMDEFHHLPGATRMPVSGSVQLQEQGDDYVVTANIPGARESDINVNLDGRLLSISSQTTGADKTTNDQGQVIEQDQYTRSYQQAFTLPGPVDAVGMHSDFKDGVLTVTIPKLSS